MINKISKIIYMRNNPKKCAPGREGNMTCYSLESLKKIALAYNHQAMRDSAGGMSGGAIIRIVDDPNILYQDLSRRLKDFCNNDDKCWKDLPFVKSLNDLEIEKFTFLPDAPQGQFAWLSTIDIDDSISQLSNAYPDFTFLGAVPMDFDSLPVLGIKNLDFGVLDSKGTHKIGIVFNTDNHNQPGKHWIAAFVDIKDKKIYFFDSVGTFPEDRVIAFLARALKYIIKKHKCPIEDVDIYYNYKQHQFGDTECGVYSINFIRRLVKGETFKQIIDDKLNDNQVNECRKVYFSY